MQTSGPPGGVFPGQPPLVPPERGAEVTPPASKAAPTAIPAPAPSPPPSSSQPVPPAYVSTASLRSITQRIPAEQLQAVADWTGIPQSQQPSQAPHGQTPGPSPQGRMVTGPHLAVPHMTSPSQTPPMGTPAMGTPAMGTSAMGTSAQGHPLAQTGPHLPPQSVLAAAAHGPASLAQVASSPHGLIPFPIVGATLSSSRGAYVVGKLIGDGQYGSVYECMGPFDQLYALKMLRPSNKPYQAVKEEWVREMQRLESFRHPNIVYIHDAFEDNYLFYLALERCDTSLRNLAQSPLPDPLFLEITRQLLMALAYLHDSGLVHSDLHAGNVLISQVDHSPIVKLTDFGVAHQLDGSTHWYRPQVANPKIIAPELLTAGYTTRQSDLYQLGLLLFQMHTGRPAIDVDRMQYGDTTRMIAEGTPRVLAEALNTRLSPVIAKLLRRRDAYRYQSAREVWEDLRVHARR